MREAARDVEALARRCQLQAAADRHVLPDAHAAPRAECRADPDRGVRLQRGVFGVHLEHGRRRVARRGQLRSAAHDGEPAALPDLGRPGRRGLLRWRCLAALRCGAACAGFAVCVPPGFEPPAWGCMAGPVAAGLVPAVCGCAAPPVPAGVVADFGAGDGCGRTVCWPDDWATRGRAARTTAIAMTVVPTARRRVVRVLVTVCPECGLITSRRRPSTPARWRARRRSRPRRGLVRPAAWPPGPSRTSRWPAGTA